MDDAELTVEVTGLDLGSASLRFTYLGVEGATVTGTASAFPEEVHIDTLLISAASGVLLGSDHLRSVPIGAIRLEIISRIQDQGLLRAEVGYPPDDYPADFSDWTLSHPATLLSETIEAVPFTSFRPAKGRGAASPDFYRSIADLYLRTLREEPRRVIAAMTEWLKAEGDQPDLSRNTVSRWVRRAREENWLTKSTRGIAGGRAGSRLRALRQLEEIENYEPTAEEIDALASEWEDQ